MTHFKLTKAQSFRVFLSNLYYAVEYNDQCFFEALNDKLAYPVKPKYSGVITLQSEVKRQLDAYSKGLGKKAMGQELTDFCTKNNISTKATLYSQHLLTALRS